MFHVFDKLNQKHGDSITPENAEQWAKAVDGGYVTDDDGRVVYGRKPVRTIDFTPTWKAILPILFEALTNGTETGQKIAREEFARMAEAADNWNAANPHLPTDYTRAKVDTTNATG